MRKGAAEAIERRVRGDRDSVLAKLLNVSGELS